jgi:hypothetical protein
MEETADTLSLMNIIYFSFGHHKDIEVYNNTISMDSVTTQISQQNAMFFNNVENIKVFNNIMTGTNQGIGNSTNGMWGTYTFDYNFFGSFKHGFHRLYDGWPGKGTADCRDIVSCRAFKNSDGTSVEAHGLPYDTNSALVYDTLASGGVEGSGDFSLLPSAPTINTGVDLSASFTTDYLGNTRQTGANTWDIGAYEYGVGGATPEEPPTTHTVTVSLSGAGGALSVSGERPVVATESISITATRYNGWNGAWSGTCPNVASCTVPDEGKTAVCSVTPTENCTATFTATSIPIL